MSRRSLIESTLRDNIITAVEYINVELIVNDVLFIAEICESDTRVIDNVPCNQVNCSNIIVTVGEHGVDDSLRDCMMNHIHTSHIRLRNGETALSMGWGGTQMALKHIVVDDTSILLGVVGASRSEDCQELANIFSNGLANSER